MTKKYYIAIANCINQDRLSEKMGWDYDFVE